MDVRATFGESGLNSGLIILLFGWPDRFTHHFCRVFNCILQPTSDVISGRFVGPVVPDNRKFGDPRLIAIEYCQQTT